MKNLPPLHLFVSVYPHPSLGLTGLEYLVKQASNDANGSVHKAWQATKFGTQNCLCVLCELGVEIDLCLCFQGLKSHAVTMFEVGKLSDESLDSFLSELEKVRQASPTKNQGEAIVRCPKGET